MKWSVLVAVALLCYVSNFETSCRASNVDASKDALEMFDRTMENAEQEDIDELHTAESDTSQNKKDEPDNSDYPIASKDTQETELKNDESTDDATTTKLQTADDEQTSQTLNFANKEKDEVDDDGDEDDEDDVDDGNVPYEESENDVRSSMYQNENEQEEGNGNEETRDESEAPILKDKMLEDDDDFPSEESENDARSSMFQNENKQEEGIGNEETRDESEAPILKDKMLEGDDDFPSEESENAARLSTFQNENDEEGSNGNQEMKDELEDLVPKDDNVENDDKIEDGAEDSLIRERRWWFSSRRRTTVTRPRPTSRRRRFTSRRRRAIVIKPISTSRRRRFTSRRRRQIPVTCRNCKGVCKVRTYAGSAFQGRTIRVHTGFVSAMNRINSNANSCGVKVHITSSFRKANVPVRGAIVPPASRSNHLVGHAIDMNLVDKGRWCNSRCLRNSKGWNKGVSCFIKKIRADSVLRWGGDFTRSDPVHIDDGYNLRNSRSYDALYANLQKNC